MDILTNEKHLIDIFAVYSSGFDDHNPTFDKLTGAHFREFKKAYLQLMLTDRKWCDETLELENAHLYCLSLILVFAHRIKCEQWMSVDPSEKRKQDYGSEMDLPVEY